MHFEMPAQLRLETPTNFGLFHRLFHVHRTCMECSRQALNLSHSFIPLDYKHLVLDLELLDSSRILAMRISVKERMW